MYERFLRGVSFSRLGSKTNLATFETVLTSPSIKFVIAIFKKKHFLFQLLLCIENFLQFLFMPIIAIQFHSKDDFSSPVPVTELQSQLKGNEAFA